MKETAILCIILIAFIQFWPCTFIQNTVSRGYVAGWVYIHAN